MAQTLQWWVNAIVHVKLMEGHPAKRVTFSVCEMYSRHWAKEQTSKMNEWTNVMEARSKKGGVQGVCKDQSICKFKDECVNT